MLAALLAVRTFIGVGRRELGSLGAGTKKCRNWRVMEGVFHWNHLAF